MNDSDILSEFLSITYKGVNRVFDLVKVNPDETAFIRFVCLYNGVYGANRNIDIAVSLNGVLFNLDSELVSTTTSDNLELNVWLKHPQILVINLTDFIAGEYIKTFVSGYKQKILCA